MTKMVTLGHGLKCGHFKEALSQLFLEAPWS